MFSLFRPLYLLLILCIFCPGKLAADTAKRAELAPIPAFIDANKRNRDIIFNNARYDSHAKVYYLYNINYISSIHNLNYYAEFLAEPSRRIFRKGAELLILLNLSESEKEYAGKYTRSGDIERQAKSCKVKSPIINSFKAVTRRLLYKQTTNSTSSYIPSGLRVVDASGNVVAYFLQHGDSIEMHNCLDNTRKVILESIKEDTWEADAILATYKELVAQVDARDANSQTKQENDSAPTATSEEEEEELEKPKKKKKKRKSPQWKKVRTNE